MAPIVIPGCFIVAIKGMSGGQEVVNVVGIHAPGNTALSIATAVLNGWKTAGGPMSQLPSTYQLVEVRAMDINSADGQVFTLPDGTFAPGAGALATNGSCALITFGSGSRMKSTRGRMYFGPLRESSINNDGRTLITAANFTGALNAFKAAVEGPNIKWVILSRKYLTFSPISVVQTQAVIATQRRRIR